MQSSDVCKGPRKGREPSGKFWEALAPFQTFFKDRYFPMINPKGKDLCRVQTFMKVLGWQGDLC